RRHDRQGLSGLVRHAPLVVEGIARDRLGAQAERVGPLLRLERERRGGGDGGSYQQQRERDRGEHAHFVSPTTTRSKVVGTKYLAATRWTSAAVTLLTRSL